MVNRGCSSVEDCLVEIKKKLGNKKAEMMKKFLDKYVPDNNYELFYMYESDVLILKKDLDGDLSGTGKMIKQFLKVHNKGAIVFKTRENTDKVYYVFIPYDDEDIKRDVITDYISRLSG